jgi:hypothetical protein
MRRTPWSRSILTLTTVSALSLFIGCGQVEEVEEDSAAIAQNLKDQAACGIMGPEVSPRDEVRACEPGNMKKTTICHVPPGNPANAHTLCIGNAAVKHHLKNHDDYLGPCKREVACPPAADAGAPGTGGAGGAGGAGGSMGEGGAGGTAGAGGTEAPGGTTGGSGTIIID